MEIAFIIVGGLVLMTIFASGFDFLAKRSKRLDDQTKQKVGQLEEKVTQLEQTILDHQEKIGQVETELSFMHKLLEDKTKQ